MEYIRVADVSEVKEGEVTFVSGKFGRVGLTMISGKIYAYQDLCSHDDSTLDPNSLTGEFISCPRHGAQFSVKSGKPISMPATEELEIYPVRISGNDVELGLE